jgi:hypothetical protein
MATKETLNYAEWFHRIMKPSTYAPGTQVEDEAESYLTCPGCGASHRDIEHGSTTTCRCGLHMQRFGNGLHIWKV